MYDMSYCFIAEEDKRCCVCISGDYFIKFKNKYHWTQHKNGTYYYENYRNKQLVTLNDLKNKYCISKYDLYTKTLLLLGAKDDSINFNLECINTQNLITKRTNRLQ